VAVGRYSADTTTSAEVAFTVHDELQGRGIGRWLLRRLAAVARHHGIDTFVAYVLPTNARMLNVFQHAGLAMESRLEDGVYTVTLRLA
jgi:GNAT superfamily N-acetyltransferase